MLETVSNQDNVSSNIDQSIHPEAPKSKRGSIFTTTFLIIALCINGSILGPAVLMVIAASFMGPAAIVPAMLLAAFFPVIGILLIADFVVIPIFLLERIVRRNFTRPWILVVAFGLWLLIGSIIVPLINRTTSGIQLAIDAKNGDKLLSKEEAVQLVQNCKIANFYQAGYGGKSPGDTLELVYKDISVRAKRSTQHSTDPKNFDALLSAAQQSTDRCGQVTYDCNSGGYDIGSAEPNDYCKTMPTPVVKEKNACRKVWTDNNKTSTIDYVPFGNSVSDGTTTIKVIQAIYNPHYIGDASHKAAQYIEVDLTITGNSQTPPIITYLPTSYPACSLTGITTVDNSAGYLHPVTHEINPAKNVKISGKTSLVFYSSTTPQVYALFEVQGYDTGYLSWTDSHGSLHILALY